MLAIRPQTMEFGLTSSDAGKYDLGFAVRLDGSTAILNALKVGYVTYNDDGTEYYTAINTTIDATESGAWLDLGDYLEQMKDGAMIRFTLNRTPTTGYAGEVKLEVYGAATPEPATLAMLGLGLAGLGVARRRMKK